jgi:DNA-binding response OmpR family regulator
MASPPSSSASRRVGILVLDNDARNSGALHQILDSEGCRVRVANDIALLVAELKTGEWSLVIANAAMIGVDTPLAYTLRELGNVPAEEGGRLRVLYIVPEMTESQFIAPLELARLPYVVRPFHLHDFLEKVSDLLIEVKAIESPLRQVRHEFAGKRKKKQRAGRSNTMFASRDSYSYSEEEIAEYERMERESSAGRHKPPTDLGGKDR